MKDLLHRRLAYVGVALLCQGCSWAFMHRPPQRDLDPTTPIECTTRRVGPAIDGFLAAAFAASSVALYVRANRIECGAGVDRGLCTAGQGLTEGLGFAAGTVGAMLGVSSAMGLHSASRCRSIQELNRTCMRGDAASCTLLTPGRSPARAVGSATAMPFPGGRGP